MIINNNRAIENAWNMLKTLYRELSGKRFRSMDITNITDLDSLYSAVIARWCASIAKEGLYKEYIEIEDEEMTSPRGQINVQASIARQSRSRGMLVCSYDELSENIYINHVLKGTLQYLMYMENVNKEQKKEMEKTMQMLNGVEYTDIAKVHWENIKFNSSNIRYKHLIETCKTLVSEHRLMKTLDLNDDKRLYILFKKQLYQWLFNKYGEEDTIEHYDRPFINVDVEPPVDITINKKQRMVVVKTEDLALIIMVRLIDEMILDDNKLYRIHEENFAFHLRDYETDYKIKTCGCILYINTDKGKLNLDPITASEVGGHFMIGMLTADIHDQWRFVTNKIENIYKYFIGKAKNRKKVAALQK